MKALKQQPHKKNASTSRQQSPHASGSHVVGDMPLLPIAAGDSGRSARSRVRKTAPRPNVLLTHYKAETNRFIWLLVAAVERGDIVLPLVAGAGDTATGSGSVGVVRSSYSISTPETEKRGDFRASGSPKN